MKNRIKAMVAVFSVLFVLGALFTLNMNNAQASENDDICSTYSEIQSDCMSIKTNCLCPIIITPDE